MSSLRGLLCDNRDPKSPVALRGHADGDQSISWGEFRCDVAGLRDRLADEPGGAWILLTDDAYAFAVGLFGLWASGRSAISPPNQQPGALHALVSRAGGTLTDRPEWFGRVDSLHPLSCDDRGDGLHSAALTAAALTPASFNFGALDRNAPAVEFFTSGTTGDSKSILKQIRHLEDEVAELGRCWNDVAQGAVIFSSASHQHLYGILFGVLWPLCDGHVFHSQHYLHAGEWVPRLAAAGNSVLASVPTHLKRFAAHAQMHDLAGLAGKCRAVFSSGGPLPTETASQIAGILGDAPIEILGSTETGGIAWRRQTPTDAPALWTPFPSARIEVEDEAGRLRVASPFVSVENGPGEHGLIEEVGIVTESGYTTGDRIELAANGQFALLGRADRIVKIAEKRLDLTRMEADLQAHKWLDAVALTTVRVEGETGGRDGARVDGPERVAAVLVPSEMGWDEIRRGGRRSVTAALREELTTSWAPVLQPRYWRFAMELPENALGKVTQEGLQALFGEADWGSLDSDRPEILGERGDEGWAERTCLVPVDLTCFPGHFPETQLVPGVLQLGWALALAEAKLGRAVQVVEVESLKLLMPLLPGARFKMRVEWPAPARIVFRFWYDSDTYSKGRIRIADSADGSAFSTGATAATGGKSQ